MRPASKNRKTDSVFRHDQPSCALRPNKVLLPDLEFPQTLAIRILQHFLQAMHLFHQPPHGSSTFLLQPINTIENP